jgi:sterol-4alpha-carboxylate 3-dehydrogenase (decarboxylating)
MTKENSRIFGTALVFGGCGYLGSHIVEALHSDGSFSAIVAASRNPTRWRIPEATYKTCDITNRVQVLQLLDEVRPAVIFHTVAPSANESDEVQYRINYASTKQLLKISRDNPAVHAFIYTGSARAIVSESHAPLTPLTEDVAVLHDLSSAGVGYERTKGAADTLTREMNTPGSRTGSSNGFKGVLLTAVVRVPALYGPRDSRTSARILARAGTRATRLQLGNNEAKHEWLYFENAAYAHVLAAKALLDERESVQSARVDGEAFFITDGAPVRFWNFSRKLWAAAGDEGCTDLSKVKVVPMGLAVAIATLVEWVLWLSALGKAKTSLSAAQLRYIDRGSWWSIEKARDTLGYVPIYSTDEGVRKTAEWFKNKKEE